MLEAYTADEGTNRRREHNFGLTFVGKMRTPDLPGLPYLRYPAHVSTGRRSEVCSLCCSTHSSSCETSLAAVLKSDDNDFHFYNRSTDNVPLDAHGRTRTTRAQESSATAAPITLLYTGIRRSIELFQAPKRYPHLRFVDPAGRGETSHSWGSPLPHSYRETFTALCTAVPAAAADSVTEVLGSLAAFICGGGVLRVLPFQISAG